MGYRRGRDTDRTVEKPPVTGGGGQIGLHALSGLHAWLRYQTTSCADGKTDCSTSSGLAQTSDGGATWQPLPNPFAH